jgi:hypothetical protein
MIAVYSENLTKPIDKLCGQNAELLNVKAGCTYSYRIKEAKAKGDKVLMLKHRAHYLVAVRK